MDVNANFNTVISYINNALKTNPADISNEIIDPVRKIVPLFLKNGLNKKSYHEIDLLYVKINLIHRNIAEFQHQKHNSAKSTLKEMECNITLQIAINDLSKILRKIEFTYVKFFAFEKYVRTVLQESSVDLVRKIDIFRPLIDCDIKLLSNRFVYLTSISLKKQSSITDSGFAHFQNLERLASLNLNGCKKITNLALFNLRGLTSLSNLNLGNCNITDDGLLYLQGLPLASLNLNGCKNITNSGLFYLRGLTSLSNLNLGNYNITDDGLLYLQGLPLASLNLNGCRGIRDRGLSYLYCLPLTHLNLGYCNITDGGLSYLYGLPITTLSLEGTSINGTGFVHMQKITRLNLSECDKLTDDSLVFLEHLSLTHLNLNFCEISNRGLSYLYDLPITTLRIKSAEITEDGLVHLQKLTRLDVEGCGLTDDNLGYLKKLPLIYLNLEDTDITIRGLRSLKGMRLKRLHLDATTNRKRGWLYLSELKPLFPHTKITQGST